MDEESQNALAMSLGQKIESNSDISDVAFYLNRSNGIDSAQFSISLDQIIATSSPSSIIEKCLIFTFVFDANWLFHAVPILTNSQKVQSILILHGQNIKDFGIGRLQTRRVKTMSSRGCHHTKMILVIYKTEGIRCCITSANTIEQDWNLKVNAVFCQDFPLKDAKSGSTSEFESTLRSYCNRYQSNINFDFLSDYDFSSAKILLIPSVPGRFRGDDMDWFGYRRVRRLLAEYGIKMGKSDELIINVSSIGQVTEQWLVDAFSAHSKLLWPTVDFVRNSIQGYEAGTTLFLSESNYKALGCHQFYKWSSEISGRDKLTPHIKTYSCINTMDREIRFFMFGSHNLSKPAWGRMDSEEYKIASFEMGCMYLPQYYAQYLAHRHYGYCLSDLPTMKRNVNPKQPAMEETKNECEFVLLYERIESKKINAKQIGFPIPMSIMGVSKYAQNDKPWIQNLSYPQRDMFGNQWIRTQNIIFLDCPFHQKEDCKALGGKWNAQKRTWFIPKGMDPTPFSKWLSKLT